MAKKKENKSFFFKLKMMMVRVRHFFSNQNVRLALGLLSIGLTIYLGFSFISFLWTGGGDQTVVESVATGEVAGNASGKGGAVVANYFMNGCFGWAMLLVLPFMVLVSCSLMDMERVRGVRKSRWGMITLFLLIWCSIFFDSVFGNFFQDSYTSPGGRNGEVMKDFICDMLGVVGLVLVLLLSALLFMMIVSPKTVPYLRRLLNFSRKNSEGAVGEDDEEEEEDDADDDEENEGMEVEVVTATETDEDDDIEQPDDVEEVDEDLELARKFDAMGGAVAPEEHSQGETVETGEDGLEMEVEAADGDDDMGGKMLRPINPKDELSFYKPPTLDLLDEYEQGVHSIDKDEQAENANKIVKALKNFGIEISSIKASVGPTITLYEITPAPGVRINKIRNLEDDIAMNLAALCVRIVAPIPGKGTVGIEVPNAHKQIVPMKSLLNSRKYKETDMALPLALGKTISNEVYMVDMAKMPHLLVAGATGMGKSVGLNAIITSLLYKMHPAYLKFVMVDPKMVELSLYSVLEKHFLAKLEGEDEPIITDVNKVVRTLKSLCVEMDNRYRLLQMASVRSVKEYNEKYLNKELLPTKGHRFMPYIVVIIDEYGDLMMTAGREVEQPIARIAQKARDVGIHMIIATQRPTTNIITGTIKANFPARMAFRVISTIDSRTILDRSGANQLQGRGDMLFLAGNDPVRVQCALVETKEVERVCDYISRQQGYQSAYILPEPDEVAEFGGDGGGSSARGDISPDKLDPLFADAARVVVLAQHGSTSLIQRKLEIGFNRAGRIMDQLCRMGIVGEQEGSKPRQVLCADEADLEFRLKSMM